MVKKAFCDSRTMPRTITLALCLLCAGCYWLRYHDLVDTHAGLMEQLAADSADQVAAANRPLRPDDIERMRYPLERARQFAKIARRRFAGRPSLDRFDELVVAYAQLVESLDRVRLGSEGPTQAAALAADVAQRAATVRAAVAAERG